jgi:small-conductance mechanosensitive channel
MTNFLITLAIFLSIANSQVALSWGHSKVAAGRETAVQTEPVIIDGKVLFSVRGVMAYQAEERAAGIAGRITTLADDPTVKIDSIVAVESDHSSDIMAGDRIVMAVFDADAVAESVSRQALARVYVAKIRMAVEKYRQDRTSERILWGAGYSLGATLLFIILILLIGRGYRRFIASLESRFAARIQKLQDQSHDILRTGVVWGTIRGGLKTTVVTLVLLILLLYVDLVLSMFPWTRAYAAPLLDLVLNPLWDIGSAILDYLPKLVFLVILVFVSRFALKLLRLFFLGIEFGRIKYSGFEATWAIPVYKITRLAVIAFTVVVAYPYIPGSESPAFKGVSLFLGIIFSLGSSSSVANFMAGYVVIFRRAFKLGDRIKIGAQTGDVIEMRLQATRLRTVKNEEIILPNSLILNSEVVNYSSLAQKGGLILHTSVTIGYDTPWRQVHAMLLLAADRTPGLLKEPQPFVLQTALSDFYVSYELNCYTDHPLEMATDYSKLHQNIQDVFNEFSVQIMSPHYIGDPAKAKIVPEEQWHQPPAKPDDLAGPI